MAKTLSMEEFRALGEISKARRRAMVNLFNGTKLKFGASDAAEAGQGLLSSGAGVYKNASKLGSDTATTAKAVGGPSATLMQQAFKDFMVQCADVENIGEIIAVIGSETVAELVGEVTPILGVLYSGYKLAKAGHAVAEDATNLYRSSDYKKGFLRGDPSAAAEAIRTIIKRDLAKHSVDLARQTTSTALKLGGLFADFGTGTTAAVGLANTLAGLGMALACLGINIKDMRAGNKRLARPDDLDLTVFEDCPILGCYLLTCADTSSVANFMVADIGLPGWMDKVEKMKKTQMDPLLKIATKNIEASPIQLEGLTSNKGTHSEKGYFAKMKAKAMKKLGFA